MVICRLCGIDKSPEELAISLLDSIRTINFKEFVEYYCQFQLDPNPDLPQSVCCSCKMVIVNFSEFSYNAEMQQLQFGEREKCDINEASQIEDIETDICDDGFLVELMEESSAVEKELMQPPKKERTKRSVKFLRSNLTPRDKALRSSLRLQHLKPCDYRIKYSKVIKEEPEDMLQPRLESKVTLTAKTESTSKPTVPIDPDRLKWKVRNFKKISKYLQEVEEIFRVDSSSKRKQYEHIEISESILPPTGEIPKSWLQKFKCVKSWHDMEFTCESHCRKRFSNLISLIQHNNNEICKNNHSYRCKDCNRRFCNYFALTSFINHVTSKIRNEHMKFCCVVCSKVFYNMPYLSKHYQENHPNKGLSLIPCLECGFYCQSFRQLIKHKQSHIV